MSSNFTNVCVRLRHIHKPPNAIHKSFWFPFLRFVRLFILFLFLVAVIVKFVYLQWWSWERCTRSSRMPFHLNKWKSISGPVEFSISWYRCAIYIRACLHVHIVPITECNRGGWWHSSLFGLFNNFTRSVFGPFLEFLQYTKKKESVFFYLPYLVVPIIFSFVRSFFSPIFIAFVHTHTPTISFLFRIVSLHS